jgi:hypothetical protein
MATWGYELEQDDFVCDVMTEFEEHLKQNQDLRQTTDLLINNYQSTLDDPDEGPLFWLALASMQWKFGKVDDKVLEQIKSDFDQDAGLERWQEIGESAFNKRKQIIADFIEKISVENPKPKKLPKIIVRKPIYQAGDCLSISLENGLYAAALVLAADHSNIEYGQNLIGVLDYMENHEPDPDVFEKREWLILNHHNWENEADICWYLSQGYRSVKKRFKLIGNIAIHETDPQESKRAANWAYLGNQMIKQKDWNQTH